jgi:hypothetical protein
MKQQLLLTGKRAHIGAFRQTLELVVIIKLVVGFPVRFWDTCGRHCRGADFLPNRRRD